MHLLGEREPFFQKKIVSYGVDDEDFESGISSSHSSNSSTTKWARKKNCLVYLTTLIVLTLIIITWIAILEGYTVIGRTPRTNNDVLQ